MKEPAAIDRILVSLDSLVDTRAGVIAQKYPDLVSKILTPKYYGRGTDEFDVIRRVEFTKLYENRSLATLQNSMMTNIYVLLAAFIKTSLQDAVTGGPQTQLVISLNIYPYQLDEEDKQDLLGALAFTLGDVCKYECVNIAPKDLTPSLCKEQYAVLVMYDFREWLTIHAPTFKDTRMPNVVIYAPKILADKPSNEEMRDFAKQGLDPFEAATIASAPAFTLRFVTVDLFCARNPNDDLRREEERQLREKIKEQMEKPEETDPPDLTA